MHFEATGKDGDKLRDFYGKVFGWTFNVMPEMDYGLVDNGGRGINGGIGTGDAAATALFYVAVADPQATLDQAEKPRRQDHDAGHGDPEHRHAGPVHRPRGQPDRPRQGRPDQTPPPSDAKPAANPVTWFEIAGKDSNKLRDFYGKLFGWQFNLPPDMDYGMIDARGPRHRRRRRRRR